MRKKKATTQKCAFDTWYISCLVHSRQPLRVACRRSNHRTFELRRLHSRDNCARVIKSSGFFFSLLDEKASDWALVLRRRRAERDITMRFKGDRYSVRQTYGSCDLSRIPQSGTSSIKSKEIQTFKIKCAMCVMKRK